MANQEDIARAQQGKDVWNAWAKENPGTGVNFHEADLKQIDFAGFVFPGAVDFASAKLDLHVSFKDTEFCDTANFDNTHFLGSGDFHGATFKGEATFHRVRFHGGGAHFNGATFEGHANFLSATFKVDSGVFKGTTFRQDAIFSDAKFQRAADFSGARFGKLAEFRAASFSGFANFEKAIFIGGPARFLDVTFHQMVHFGGVSFGEKGADFSNTKFHRYTTFDEAHFVGYANLEGAKFHEVASFRSTEWHGLANFNNTNFDSIAVFFQCIFAAVPTFHGATLHEGTTFEGVAWPERPHEGQSPYDAASAWAWLRVEMSRSHSYEDELSFFAKEIDARARDVRNEPRGKRLLYRIYLALGAGRSVAKPFVWLAGLNMFLFLPIYWFANSAIQWRNLPIQDVIAEVVSFGIPADVVSITLGQALPFIGSSNPERADLYRRLFARADSAGIYMPLWLEIVGVGQQLAGGVLVFLIALALRNRFRMK